MAAMKVYAYKNCSTCQKALRYLQERGIAAEVLAIVEQPPSLEELRQMLTYVGNFKKLFNTSGALYREMKIAERALGEAEALQLLSQHGKLVRRPFALGPNHGTVGFQAEEWAKFS